MTEAERKPGELRPGDLVMIVEPCTVLVYLGPRVGSSLSEDNDAAAEPTSEARPTCKVRIGQEHTENGWAETWVDAEHVRRISAVQATEGWRDACADAIREGRDVDAMTMLLHHSELPFGYVRTMAEIAQAASDFAKCFIVTRTIGDPPGPRKLGIAEESERVINLYHELERVLGRARSADGIAAMLAAASVKHIADAADVVSSALLDPTAPDDEP